MLWAGVSGGQELPEHRSPPPGVSEGLTLLEAVALTLANDSAIAIVESRELSARGGLMISSARFDPVLEAGATGSDLKSPLSQGTFSETERLSQSLGAAWLLRSGLSLEPSLQLTRSDDGSQVLNESSVSFVLRQPLLRGRGREAVAAEEIAAERELAASQLDLRQTVAERLRAVAAQYWVTASAKLDLEVLRSTEERSLWLLETTRKLVAADVAPAADLVQLEADLTAREAARIEGERALFEARQILGREIGLAPAEIALLALPDDPFPELDPARAPALATAGQLIERALAERSDLHAGRQRLAAAEVLLRAAENALEPRLDLVFEPSYASLVEGAGLGDAFAPLTDEIPGLSASLSLNFSWPLRNRQARGLWTQREAARREQALRVEQLARQIGADVPTALDGVARGIAQLERARRAVVLFEQVVEDEEKKLRAGSSTLIDVLSQRDRLTSARQREVSAQLALALAILELRFQTGTLVETEGELETVDVDRLTTPPVAEGAG